MYCDGGLGNTYLRTIAFDIVWHAGPSRERNAARHIATVGTCSSQESDICTSFTQLHLPTRAPGTSELSKPWLNNRTCRSITLPSSTSASWQPSPLVRASPAFLASSRPGRSERYYVNAVIQRAPLRYLLLRQAIPVRRHRPLHQIEGYALRSEERSPVIAVCAWWFYRQFRCEG